MPQVEWDGTLAIGVDIIDTQHKELFRIINSFSDRIGRETETFTLSVILDSLKNYVHYHFASEEALLAKNNYPELDRHVGEHSLFASLVVRYEQRKNTIDHQGLLDLQKFLLGWLVSHIRESDLPLKQYLAP